MAKNELLPPLDLDLPTSITIAVPIGEQPPDGYVPEHVQARLNAVQGEALRRLKHSLDDGQRRLRGNRRVDSYAGVVQWLLEQAALKLDEI